MSIIDDFDAIRLAMDVLLLRKGGDQENTHTAAVTVHVTCSLCDDAGWLLLSHERPPIIGLCPACSNKGGKPRL